MFNKKFLLFYLLKTTLLLLILFSFVFFLQESLLKPFYKYISDFSEILISGVDININNARDENNSMIRIKIKTIEDIRSDGGELILPRGKVNTFSAQSINFFVPTIITFSLVLAWPFSSLSHGLVSFSISTICSVLILFLTIPFQIAGIFETYLSHIAKRKNISFDYSTPYYWQVFCEDGGIWFMAILAAMFTIYFSSPWTTTDK